MATKIDNYFITDEITYQTIFYDKLLSEEHNLRIDRSTDGYIDGTIFEHKPNVTSYGRGKTLSQALIYLTRFNRDGIPVPKNIMLVSQEEQKVYLYDSNDYVDIINDIEHYATLPASKGIDDFEEKSDPIVISYDLNSIPSCRILSEILNQKASYIKVEITKHNVYGWATYFYNNSKNPKKVNFFEEIKNPKDELKDFIKPWKGHETDFSLIMDLLNDPYQQKKLGAYYTPPAYAKKAVELVRKAIANVPDGNDYIILDRCAGTGALESELSEEELSHVIINTYELKEWHALRDRLGGLVRKIIPPIPAQKNTYPPYDSETGFLSGADALSQEFVYNEDILKYVNDPKCTVILFENPPYKDITSKNKTNDDVKSFLYNEFVENGTDEATHRDLVNLFIWSGVKYYLKKPSDAYIVFAPIKYYKTCNFFNENFIFYDGFIFNKEHFHATASAVSCVMWLNNGLKNEEQPNITLKAYDIVDEKLKFVEKVIIKKVYSNFSPYAPKSKLLESDIPTDVFVDGKTGIQSQKTSNKKAVYNENIVGYLRATSYNLSGFSGYLTRTITQDALDNSYGYYLRKDDFLYKLPLFAAKKFPEKDWHKKGIYFTTADKGLSYLEDKEFLKKCLIWTCLSDKNKSCSFFGTDCRFYKNELCLSEGTVAKETLDSMIKNGITLSNIEKELISEYEKIIKEIKRKDIKTDTNLYEEFNPRFTYGLFQINKQINIKITIGYTKFGKEKTAYKYGNLNNKIKAFNKKVQDYYNNYISNDLFKYELLK